MKKMIFNDKKLKSTNCKLTFNKIKWNKYYVILDIIIIYTDCKTDQQL